MLRINLLPPYIYDKQKKVKLAVFWAILVAGALGAFFFWFVTLNHTLDDKKKEQADAEALKTTYDGVQSKIGAEKTQRAQIEARSDFITNSQKYNDSWATGFELMRDVTTNDILLKSMSFDKTRKVVSFAGFAAKEEDIVRWWQYLRNNYSGPDAALPFDTVSFGLPAHAYEPDKAATAGGPGGKEGAAGFGSGGGGFSGGAGGPMGSAGGPGTPGGPMGSAGGPMTPGGPGGRGGGGGGNQQDKIGPGEILGKKGINFVASVVLKKPLADGIQSAPVWTGGGAAPVPGGGGFGGPGGGPMTPGGRGGAPMSGGGPSTPGG